MSDFYHQLANRVKPANALRKAQQKAIQKGQHPYYWASVVAIGA
jgi:CHAT domain-containing protein